MPNPFASRFMAGYECSTHRRKVDGKRLDLIAATAHDVHACRDYALAAADGLRTARDGLRWHLIEAEPGRYDWSSWLPMLAAAGSADMQVIWDLWHYGTPDWLDIFSAEFPARFAAFAAAAARVHSEYSNAGPLWCPVNEMSFFSQMAGEVGHFHPFAHGRGHELKRQLVRAAAAASVVLRVVDSRARLVWGEPTVNVLPSSFEPGDRANAEGWRQAQFQVFDMLCGRMDPELGGRPEILDIVGANFYPHNQWIMGSRGSVPLGHHDWRPFAEMLIELHERYGRPILVAETGAEGSARASWLHYVAGEVDDARRRGADVQGICLYPVLAYPGWDNGRACQAGLYGPADGEGRREVCEPLLAELRRQQAQQANTAAARAAASAFMLRSQPQPPANAA